ncbi:glycosyltransferase family 4 protein [Gottfriedia sp. NPDC058432]|uniref:glycosyltransferase family 4 protein n=1 Tax=Gottfriedia sp. NPDC058432 TaxID=3346497 RepID=UPI00364A4989
MNKRVLIIRNFASQVNADSYNLQEVGLGKALVKKGFDCDIVYYSDSNTFDEVIYEYQNRKLTIKWTKAIKFMSNSIFYSMLKKSVLSQYEFIISTEYNQIMTLLLAIFCKDKVYLYHGPYLDNNKRIVQIFYDTFLTPIIKRLVVKVFTKSDLAKEYLINKGFKNVKTIGVGLDSEKLDTNIKITMNDICRKIDLNKKNLLYIGVLEERRNIEFLFNIVSKLVKKDSNINLVVVGNGREEDTKKYFNLARELEVENNIFHLKKLKQSELKYLYQNLDLFIFPTNYDIFGMVLLESMYFKLPVISTFNGGAQTLLNKENGLVLNNLDENTWVESIYSILNNQTLRGKLGENARNKILEGYTWDKIVKKILSES